MFEKITYEKFIAAVNPKMNGALNIHKALLNAPLDFFVTTSSISAVIGNPGQANYCTGNSFLDSLAWHRNQNGLAASSLALPMVLDIGIVAENEHIETSLSRKGMYGIDEREMIRGFEVAMKQANLRMKNPASIGNAQIILGLEPAHLAAAVSSCDIADVDWYMDARLSGIRAAVDLIRSSSTSTDGFCGDFMGSLKHAKAEGPDALIQAIAVPIIKRCSSILMTPSESFDFDGKSIGAYGLDSMIGAELRNWLFKEFGLDIGFQALLAPTLTFKALSEIVAETITGS